VAARVGGIVTLGGGTGISSGTVIEPTPHEALPNRFYGSVKLNPLRASRDIGKIAQEVVQHLTKQVSAEVEMTLEIRAKLPKGADEKLRRDVTENCRTLNFDTCEFENKK